MKIVYAANIRLPTERAHGLQIMEMCRAFAQEGHDVRLVVPKRRNAIEATPWEHYGMPKDFEIVEVPIFDFIRFDRVLGKLALWLNALWFSRAATRAVRAFAPDVVYARDPWFSAFDPRAKYVFEAHDFPSSVTPIHRRFWSRATRIVAVTEGLRKAFISAGVPEAKLLVAHDGVDAAKFDVPETKAEARAKLGLLAEGFIAVYTGHLYPYKGADDLLEASMNLRPASRVVFVGGRPDDLARLKARAEALGAKNAVFVGPVQHVQVPSYLRAADAAVLPTRASDRHASEFLSPLKLFEYLAAGKAIVATDTPSVREVLTGREALFVPPSDPEALAKALNDLADVPGKVAELERASAALAPSHSWRRRADVVLEGLPESHPFQTWYRRYRTELMIAGLAFAIRAAYVLFFPQVGISGGDGPLYLTIADSIRGKIPQGTAAYDFYQPLYPWLLAGIRTIFGESLLWIRLAQAALSAATVFIMAVMARKLVSARAGFLAGLVGALHAPMVIETGMIYIETLYAFLLTLGMALYLEYLSRPSVRRALIAGTSFAVAGLARELGFYLAVVLTALAMTLKKPRLLAVFMLVPVLIAVGGLQVRNARIAESRAVPGAPLLSKGYEETLQDPNSRKFLLRFEMYPLGVWRFFRYPHRLAEISDETSTKEVLRSGDPALIAEQAPRILAKGTLTLMHWLLLMLGVYGLWRGKMSREAKLAFATAIAFAAGTIILGSVARLQGFEAFEPLARYRFPVEPLILILAASGIDRLLRKSA
jgi:glycosyltransferase involved in cell wall biosynthesis